jgi:hypothetical protein
MLQCVIRREFLTPLGQFASRLTSNALDTLMTALNRLAEELSKGAGTVRSGKIAPSLPRWPLVDHRTDDWHSSAARRIPCRGAWAERRAFEVEAAAERHSSRISHVEFAEDRRKEDVVLNPRATAPLLGVLRLALEIHPTWQLLGVDE